jgi:hypothetical protein
MERRREPRIEIDHTVQLTVFGTTNVRVPARALDFSGRGLKLAVERAVALGSAVKVETEDSLFLGEVCHCGPAETGFVLGLELQQALVGLRELAILNSRLVEGWQSPYLVEDEATAGRSEQHRELWERESVGL